MVWMGGDGRGEVTEGLRGSNGDGVIAGVGVVSASRCASAQAGASPALPSGEPRLPSLHPVHGVTSPERRDLRDWRLLTQESLSF